VLEQIGIKYIFGLIGDSLNPLADAIRYSKSNGLALATGKAPRRPRPVKPNRSVVSAFAPGTPGPGSNHLVAGRYEVARDHAPVLALSGDMPRKMQARFHPDHNRRAPTELGALSSPPRQPWNCCSAR
jgi:glyoxylate carboligase